MTQVAPRQTVSAQCKEDSWGHSSAAATNADSSRTARLNMRGALSELRKSEGAMFMGLRGRGPNRNAQDITREDDLRGACQSSIRSRGDLGAPRVKAHSATITVESRQINAGWRQLPTRHAATIGGLGMRGAPGGVGRDLRLPRRADGREAARSSTSLPPASDRTGIGSTQYNETWSTRRVIRSSCGLAAGAGAHDALSPRVGTSPRRCGPGGRARRCVAGGSSTGAGGRWSAAS